MRTIKLKQVQVVEHYQDHTEVYQDLFPIRWKDFGINGIRRRIDKDTGLPFLVLTIKMD